MIHGGPGAPGSLYNTAKKLSEKFAVLEPIQSKYSITDLTEEMHTQLTLHSKNPLTLIGHSWGAWLSIIYTLSYPHMVNRVILVSCAPFETKYVTQITERRLQRLTVSQQSMFKHLTEMPEQNGSDKEKMQKLSGLTEKSDNYNVAKNIIKILTA